jgi:hypothetical protein
VGDFAENHRNRNGAAWFLLALLISPLLAFIFCGAASTKSSGPLKVTLDPKFYDRLNQALDRIDELEKRLAAQSCAQNAS